MAVETGVVLIWIVSFALIWFFMGRSKTVLWHLLGWTFMWINSLVGIIILDSAVVWIVMLMFTLLWFKECAEDINIIFS